MAPAARVATPEHTFEYTTLKTEELIADATFGLQLHMIACLAHAILYIYSFEILV